MAQNADDDDQPVDSPERQRSERLKSRIQDPAAQQFTSVASLLYGYGKYSAEHIINEVEKVNSAGDRLFVLRQWTTGNAERNDAAVVLERALDILVGTTDYVPTARDLRQLAAPLPFIATEAAKNLVVRFSGLRGTLEHRSSTDDDVALQLLLARAEAKYDKEAARNRVLEIYLDLCDVDDLSIKSGCLARLMAALSDIDPDHALETSDGIHTDVKRDLEAAFESLLKTTAEQHDATKTIIGPLIRTHPQLALDWIARLNTYHRRDAALLDFVSSGARLPASYFVLSPIETALSRFVDTDLRDEALLRLIPRLEAMAQEKADKGEEPEFRSLLITLNRVDAITDLEKRCLGHCLNLSLLSNQKPGTFDGLRDKWLGQLEASWNAIDAQWRQVDVGFKIAAALSEHYLDAAHDFMRRTGEVRQSAAIDNDTTASSYMACLLLALRTYCGLLPRKVASPEDFERLTMVITAVPSVEDQVRLWTDLALRCHLKKDVERGADITERFIRPLLSKLSSVDTECRYRCIVLAAPALYVAHQATSLRDIESLPILHKTEACDAVCRYLLYSVAPSDPCTPELGQGFRISYNVAVDVCVMMEIMTGDSQIHHYMMRLVDCIRESSYTREQTVELISRLEKIVTTKLPAPNGIEHEGYCIACRAQIARLKRDNQDWLGLIDAARQLPNSADVVHVLCGIAVAMPQRDQAKREGLLEEVRSIVAAISTLRDRFERYELLTEAADRVNPVLARRYLIEAMQGALKEAQTHEQQASGLEPPTGSNAYTAARRFIDMAHRFDKDWATHLTALADTEPVRQGLKDSLKERVKHLELRKKVANELQVQDDLSGHDVEEWSRLSWTLLGQLTASRLQPWHRSEARDFVRIASQAPLQDSYPLLAWTIENTVRRHSSTDQARSLLHPLFDATLQGAHLALQISARSATQLEYARQDAARSTHDEIIDPGQRMEALQIVEEWIENNFKGYLKICDPFLGPSDTCEILRLVSRYHPDCQVEIMTSRKWLQDEKINQPWQDAFKRQWRQGSDQNPPDTDITVIGVGTDGQSPIHDRWWLTEGSGLQIGTSYSGIGKRGHTIDQLSFEKATEREATFDRYLSRRLRESEGQRISRETFNLG